MIWGEKKSTLFRLNQEKLDFQPRKLVYMRYCTQACTGVEKIFARFLADSCVDIIIMCVLSCQQLQLSHVIGSSHTVTRILYVTCLLSWKSMGVVSGL